jgi:GLPGLI family protein
MISSKLIFRFLVVSCLFLQVDSFAQITQGRIVYERKTNLHKRFADEDTRRWLGEKNKTKIDQFELFFNDSLSYFRPIESDLKEEMSWATNKNQVFQNHVSNSRISAYNVWGEDVFVKDSLVKRTWKITDSKRKIGNYECRKAMWEVNDSLRIYAWYTDEIIPSIGPESFVGLPGAILGVATEDGGVIYFAKTVEVIKPDFTKLTIKTGKGKIMSQAETRQALEKQFSNRAEMKKFIDDLFTW